jgi:hypothetical protein
LRRDVGERRYAGGDQSPHPSRGDTRPDPPVFGTWSLFIR